VVCTTRQKAWQWAKAQPARLRTSLIHENITGLLALTFDKPHKTVLAHAVNKQPAPLILRQIGYVKAPSCLTAGLAGSFGVCFLVRHAWFRR